LRPGAGGGIEFYSYPRIFDFSIEEALQKVLLQNLIRYLIERKRILSAIIELRNTVPLMRRYLLNVFEACRRFADRR
jgi:hypothetical protein